MSCHHCKSYHHDSLNCLHAELKLRCGVCLRAGHTSIECPQNSGAGLPRAETAGRDHRPSPFPAPEPDGASRGRARGGPGLKAPADEAPPATTGARGKAKPGPKHPWRTPFPFGKLYREEGTDAKEEG